MAADCLFFKGLQGELRGIIAVILADKILKNCVDFLKNIWYIK